MVWGSKIVCTYSLINSSKIVCLFSHKFFKNCVCLFSHKFFKNCVCLFSHKFFKNCVCLFSHIFFNQFGWNWGFLTRMVYLYYISCLRYTILVGNPRFLVCCYNIFVETYVQFISHNLHLRERSLLWWFHYKTCNVCLVACELIYFKLGMTIDKSTLHSVTWVWITLAFFY